MRKKWQTGASACVHIVSCLNTLAEVAVPSGNGDQCSSFDVWQMQAHELGVFQVVIETDHVHHLNVTELHLEDFTIKTPLLFSINN